MGVALAVGLQGQAGKCAGWSRLRQGKCHTEEEVQATGTVCSELSLQQGLGCSVFLTDSAVESRVCFWGRATQCRPRLSPPKCQLLLTFVPNLPHCPSPSSQSGPQLSVLNTGHRPGVHWVLASSKASFDKDTP